MKKENFLLSMGEQLWGPVEKETLFEATAKGAVTPLDLCWDQGRQKWLPVCELPGYKAFSKKSDLRYPVPDPEDANVFDKLPEVESDLPDIDIVTAKETVLPNKEAVVSKSDDVDSKPRDLDVQEGTWYVKHSSSTMGPMTFGEIIKKLQHRTITKFDLYYNKNMKDWTRGSLVPDLSADNIRNFYMSRSGDNNIFRKRETPRFDYPCNLICHNNNGIWKGKCVNLSRHGARIDIQTPSAIEGKSIILHFRPQEDHPPMNVVTEIISVEKKEKQSATCIVKFLFFSKESNTAIEKLVENLAA